MNQPPYDPNSLNDELDHLLAAGQPASVGASDDPLVEAALRLNTAPRLRLSPQAADRIRTAVLAAHSAAPTASGVSLLTPSRPLRLALVAAATLVLVAATLFAVRNNLQFLGAPAVDSIVTQTHTPAPSLTPTSTSTVPLIPPEVTAVQASATAIVPSAMPTERPVETASVTTVVPSTTITASAPVVPSSLSATVALSPTSALTHTPAPTEFPVETAAVTAEPLIPVTIVIEGPVQAINGSTITIFDLVILLNPDDPLLGSIAVGVFIRVEGSFAMGNEVITALYVTLSVPETPVNPSSGAPEVNQNPSGGEVWIDSGDCSNPPPPWAPANGWRRRCENLNPSGNNDSSGQNENRGNGSSDDDDHDGGDGDDD